MAKKITKYQAEDGTEFDLEADADHHDRKIIARNHFRAQLADPSHPTCDWDFTMAFVPDDSDVLVIGVHDLPDFLVNNAARIQSGYYASADTKPVQKPKPTHPKVKSKPAIGLLRKADNH